MADVVTLTMNPSIDLSVSVERVAPFHKLRSSDERRDPGGGGINVARVLKRLGADVTAVYPSGGALGQLLRQLVDREGIAELTIPISGETREDFTVVERATGYQYRFILPGPRLSEHEWHACLAKFDALDRRTSFVVCSGSLPPGVPDDFYGRVVQAAKLASTRIIIDSSGPSLRAALQRGVYLVKPNLNELRSLFGEQLQTQADWIKACRSLIDKQQAEIVVLTLGEQGALLVTGNDILRLRASHQARQRRRRRRQLPRRHDLEPGDGAHHGNRVSLRRRRRVRGLAVAGNRIMPARGRRASRRRSQNAEDLNIPRPSALPVYQETRRWSFNNTAAPSKAGSGRSMR